MHCVCVFLSHGYTNGGALPSRILPPQTRPPQVWYDPVPRALGHGLYLESGMSGGGGLIGNIDWVPRKLGFD